MESINKLSNFVMSFDKLRIGAKHQKYIASKCLLRYHKLVESENNFKWNKKKYFQGDYAPLATPLPINCTVHTSQYTHRMK